MDDQTKQRINNIVSLAKQRKYFLNEINNLDDYKKKIDLVKQKYARKNGGSKTPRTKATRGRK